MGGHAVRMNIWITEDCFHGIHLYVDFGIEENRFICDAVLNLNAKENQDA